MPKGVTTIVILGATGDLTRRKLVPALFNLRCNGRLPEALQIVGFARSNYSDDQFRELMWKGVQEFSDMAMRKDEWKMFAQSLHYAVGDLGKLDHLSRLEERLKSLEGEARPVNRLFYLSIAPHLYEKAIQNLGASTIAQEDSGCAEL